MSLFFLEIQWLPISFRIKPSPDQVIHNLAPLYFFDFNSYYSPPCIPASLDFLLCSKPSRLAPIPLLNSILVPLSAQNTLPLHVITINSLILFSQFCSEVFLGYPILNYNSLFLNTSCFLILCLFFLQFLYYIICNTFLLVQYVIVHLSHQNITTTKGKLFVFFVHCYIPWCLKYLSI